MRDRLTFPPSDRLLLFGGIVGLGMAWAMLCLVSRPPAPPCAVLSCLDPLTPPAHVALSSRP